MITWISVKQDLPKQLDRVTDDGQEYKSSNMVLIWTSDKEEPLGLGCLEDDKWYINGVGGYDETVTHWAYINKPDGFLLKVEYYA